MPSIDNKSEEAVCNLALGHLGVSEQINLITERSATAAACRMFFSTARDVVFRDFKHPFTTKFADLALVETEPNSEWLYSYRYPSDCLFFRRVLSGSRVDTSDTKIAYRIASDDVGKLIYTDKVNAEGEYTRMVTTVLLWPDDIIMAVSLLLASLMAPRITRGDGVKLGDRAYQLYETMRSISQSNAENEEQVDVSPEAESIRARE